MLVELSVVEQRYHAVMEALSGAPVVEVAERYGVSRKSVHHWVRRYREDGLAGLTDRSHRPHHHPWQIAPEIEAAICEMRRNHPRWGPRRLGHELARADIVPVPSRSSIYRTLVRHQLVSATTRKRARSDYVRWERPESMQLWQLDIMGSVMITDDRAVGGVREVKLVTGIDDHSRYCVIATVTTRGTSRAVCTAFLAALARFGAPQQVLTDNGVQFTGKYLRPRPTEVLFDQICRRNGIEHLLTKIRSPPRPGRSNAGTRPSKPNFSTTTTPSTRSGPPKQRSTTGCSTTTTPAPTSPATWTPRPATSTRSHRAAHRAAAVVTPRAHRPAQPRSRPGTRPRAASRGRVARGGSASTPTPSWTRSRSTGSSRPAGTSPSAANSSGSAPPDPDSRSPSGSTPPPSTWRSTASTSRRCPPG